MSSMPETRYAKSGDTYIAYQVMGDGPFDLIFVPGFVAHLDMQMEQQADTIARHQKDHVHRTGVRRTRPAHRVPFARVWPTG
jgi:hypothetical protein